MHVYAMNLTRSADRRKHILSQLEAARADYTVVTAVEGREVDRGDTSLVDPSFTWPDGSVGCSLSHVDIYRRILADGHQSALILEDDVELPADLNEMLDAVAGQLSGAEIVMLNYHTERPCRLARAGSVPLPAGRVLAVATDEGQLHSTAGYVITRQGCAGMLGVVLPIRATSDDWAFYRREGALDRVRCVVPQPVPTSAAFRSVIDYRYQTGSPQQRIREWLAGARIPVLHQALAIRRRRSFARLGYTGWTEFVD